MEEARVEHVKDLDVAKEFLGANYVNPEAKDMSLFNLFFHKASKIWEGGYDDMGNGICGSFSGGMPS